MNFIEWICLDIIDVICFIRLCPRSSSIFNPPVIRKSPIIQLVRLTISNLPPVVNNSLVKLQCHLSHRATKLQKTQMKYGYSCRKMSVTDSRDKVLKETTYKIYRNVLKDAHTQKGMQYVFQFQDISLRL